MAAPNEFVQMPADPPVLATEKENAVAGQQAPNDAMQQQHQPGEKHATNSIQVSLDKTPQFYARIGRRMLLGSADKEPFEEVIVTGLGNATNVAISTASIMERDELATITKVETAYFTSVRAKKRLPKITITLVRNPNVRLYTAEDAEEAKTQSGAVEGYQMPVTAAA